MVLHNLHILAKIKARLMVIQLGTPMVCGTVVQNFSGVWHTQHLERATCSPTGHLAL